MQENKLYTVQVHQAVTYHGHVFVRASHPEAAKVLALARFRRGDVRCEVMDEQAEVVAERSPDEIELLFDN